MIWQLNADGKLKKRLSFKGYDSGHRMYLRNEDLIKATDDIRTFITKSSININKGSKY
ncbi:hypothetical protein [Aquimarina atlantica]|uniref:hypothetical protein n=1 Tax=Aquimarina atlantica TaxID=1317122 RepID=UPI000B0B4E3F|nr:hypothetical protein [Aquimarina atlantica]